MAGAVKAEALPASSAFIFDSSEAKIWSSWAFC